jgi:hypothetical protein
MLGEIFDKTIDGVIDYINNLKRLYLDHDHDGLNSKTVSNKSEVVDIASAQTITGLKFDMIVVDSNNFGTGFAKVYKNGSAVGTEREQTSQSSAPYTYTTYSEDFNITRAEINANVDGVKIQIYAYVNNILYATKIENFRIYYDRDYSVDYEVITN